MRPEDKVEEVNKKIIDIDRQIEAMLLDRHKYMECKLELQLDIKPISPRLSELAPDANQEN